MMDQGASSLETSCEEKKRKQFVRERLEEEGVLSIYLSGASSQNRSSKSVCTACLLFFREKRNDKIETKTHHFLHSGWMISLTRQNKRDKLDPSLGQEQHDVHECMGASMSCRNVRGVSPCFTEL